MELVILTYLWVVKILVILLMKSPDAFSSLDLQKIESLTSTPHHCSHFDIDEEALLIGTNTFIQLIEDLLINKII